MSFIKMIDPDGIIGDVSLHNVGKALDADFKPYNKDGLIRMRDPDGYIGNVKNENLKGALDAQFTIVEKDLSDMPKEFATGVTAGIGNLADKAGAISNATIAKPLNLAHEYIGAPIDRARANIVEGAGKAVDYLNETTGKGGDALSQTLTNWSNSAQERATELRTQADEEDPYTYKQNLKKDLPDAVGLKDDHKARSKMSDAVRSAGEFVPDVVDTVLISKGVGKLAEGMGTVKAFATNGKVVNAPWLDKLNKFLEVGTDVKSLTKLGIGFAGAGAGYSLAKKGYRPEDERATTTVGKVAQTSLDIAREIAGMTLGSLTVSGVITGATRAISTAISNPKEILSIVPFTRATAERKFANKYGGEIDEAILKIAKDNDLPPRLDMLIDNPKTSHLVQNTLRSGFVDQKVYKPFTQVGEKIKKKIDEDILTDISPYLMSKEEVGDVATQAIKARQEAWKAESSRLYEEAEKLAVNSSVDVMPLKKLLEQRLRGLERGAPEDLVTVRNNLGNKLKAIESGKTGLEDLFAFKKALNEHGQTDKSYAGLYGEVADTINDILTKHAKSGEAGSDFTKAWQTAVQYNKENVQAVKQMDVVRSLLKQNSPRETLDYMSSGRRVREVIDILGKENSKIAGIVKRSKIEDIFAKSAAFSSDDVNPEALGKLFTTKEDLLKELMGANNYRKFTKEFLPYIMKYDNAKGIVWTANDQRLIEAQERLLKKSLKSAAYGGIGGFLTHEITQAGGKPLLSGIGAAIGVFVPGVNSQFAKYQIRNIKMLSQIASDPKILDRIIKKAKVGDYKKLSKIDKYAPNAVRTEIAKEVLKQIGNLPSKAVEYKKDVLKDYEQDPNKRPLGKILNSEPVGKITKTLEKLGFGQY